MVSQRKSIELLILLISIFCSCSGSQKENAKISREKIGASFADGKSFFKQGDTIRFSLQSLPDGGIVYTIDDSDSGVIDSVSLFSLATDTISLGYHSIMFGTKKENVTLHFSLLSKTSPRKLSYSIVNTYPHSIFSYTQGLVFDGGYLLESTGLRGKSKLLQVSITSGEAEKSVSLDQKYFGEGLAMVGSKLYQLTWQSNKGFIYSKENFVKEREFFYPTEGWGLCFDGTDLIMSDGSQFLYFMDTASLEVKRQIPVLDNLGPVTRLNELEYVDGQIFANVYMTNTIVRIDPKTGAVTGKLDCYGILEQRYRHKDIDVLNGIAHNAETGLYYITGKNWPILFEIEITEAGK